MVDIKFLTVLNIYYMCTAKKENIKESAAKCYMSRIIKAFYKSRVSKILDLFYQQILDIFIDVSTNV